MSTPSPRQARLAPRPTAAQLVTLSRLLWPGGARREPGPPATFSLATMAASDDDPSEIVDAGDRIAALWRAWSTRAGLTVATRIRHVGDGQLMAFGGILSSTVAADLQEMEPLQAGQLSLAVRLFWPDLVEIDDCVLYADRYQPDNLRQWLAATGGDLSRIEHVLNETHLYDETYEDETPLEELEDAALRLKAALQAATTHHFPDRDFHFTYGTEPYDYGPTVAFYQLRGRGRNSRQRRGQ